MMDFHWKYINDDEYWLIGYYEQVIAKLKWEKTVEMWELESEWIDCSSDISIDVGENDIAEVQEEAIDILSMECDDKIDWYKSQQKMLEKVNKD
ncbi:hypothetical protein M2146_001098 [Lachnospiraceae bacterium PF1-22]